MRIFGWRITASGGEWQQLGGTISGAASGDKFGFCRLDSDGSHVACGAKAHGDSGNNKAGEVQVYELSDSSTIASYLAAGTVTASL